MKNALEVLKAIWDIASIAVTIALVLMICAAYPPALLVAAIVFLFAIQ